MCIFVYIYVYDTFASMHVLVILLAVVQLAWSIQLTDGMKQRQFCANLVPQTLMQQLVMELLCTLRAAMWSICDNSSIRLFVKMRYWSLASCVCKFLPTVTI